MKTSLFLACLCIFSLSSCTVETLEEATQQIDNTSSSGALSKDGDPTDDHGNDDRDKTKT